MRAKEYRRRVRTTEAARVRGYNAVQGKAPHRHDTTALRSAQDLTDAFDTVKERCSATGVAQLYGFTPNRAGFICCPFHGERTPSLKLFSGNRGWYCFGCHEGGDVVQFVSRLYGLNRVDALRKLNGDFALGLDLDRPLSEQEQAKVARRQERQNFVRKTEKRFNAWRNQTLRMLSLCLSIADDAEGVPPDDLTEEEILALRYAPALACWWDTLNDERDTPERFQAQMAVFNDRKGVEQVCRGILSSLQTRLMNSCQNQS